MIRVRPNLHSFALGCIAVTMWYAGAAQQNGGAYILSFLTMAIAVVSMLQARANLRGIQIHAGVIPPTEAGKAVRVPLMLTVGDGQEPCGIEITGAGVASPIFIDKVSVEEPRRIELSITDTELGRHEDLTVLVRSYFPLGIFTAQRAIKLTQTRTVLPRPEGTLPLPPIIEHKADDGRASDKPGKVGEGDDFAGLREWQAGDPLRHVDWKAVARGRPMMVKLWSGAPAGEVWLDWNALELPSAQRLQQLAKWIDEAEGAGVDYGLRLPGVELAPARGVEHRRRCLEALAMQADGDQQRVATVNETSARAAIVSCETQSSLPGNPMRLMLIALAIVAMPMIMSVPLAGSLCLYGCVIWRWFGLRKKQAPVSLWRRLTMISVGVAATFAQSRTFVGIEPEIAVMLIMAAGKVLETRTPRDLQVLAALGWVLCMCNLTLEQSIGRSLWTYAGFLLIVIAVVRLRRGASGMKVPLRVTTRLLVQSVPFVVLLFLFFPRGTASMVVRATRSLTNRTGMSDNLDPGSIASIARNNEIAFRVALEGRNFRDIPPASRYWRCGVLWNCEVGNGLRWQPAAMLADMPQRAADPKTGFTQHIQLLPHGGRWLPALDVPTIDKRGNTEHYLSKDDNTLRSNTPVNNMRTYDVVSHLELPYKEAKPGNLEPALKLPLKISKAVFDLAMSFKQGGDEPEKIVRAGLAHFRDGSYQYSIEPGEYDKRTGLDDFLFTRRLGFCEHYAAAFATLMRIAGVPSRVVIGYQGGEYVQGSGYMIVRQSDAHAWTEVYIPGKGWQRTDPTAALAPQRLTNDLRSTLEDGAQTAFAFARNSWLGGIQQDVELVWDQANYFWYDRVVQFDEFKQQDLWSSLGLYQMPAIKLAAWGLALFGLPLLVLSLWLSRRARHPDPAVQLWLKFCDRLAKQGITREPGEGPLAFAKRAAQMFPARAAGIENAANLYAQHRYGVGVPMNALRAALAVR